MYFLIDTIHFDVCPSDPLHACASLLLLQIPYSYLIYRYFESISRVVHKKKLKSYDFLDKGLIVTSLICLLTISLTLIVDTGFMLELCKFVWYWWIFAIFVKFQCENIRIWKIIMAGFSFVYFVYFITVNVLSTGTDVLIPIKYPTICLNIMTIFIGVSERWEIWKIFV